MSFRATARRIREAIGNSAVSVPYGLVHLTFDLKEAPRQESRLARIAREGGRWWESDQGADNSRDANNDRMNGGG